MKKIFNFYIKAFFYISLISIPFIFVAIPDLSKNEFTHRIWISTFIPQLIYIAYLFKTNKLYESFKTNLIVKPFHFNIIIFSLLIPPIIYIFLIGFKLIRVYGFYNWDINILIYFILIFLSALSEEILFRFIPYKLLVGNITMKKIILISSFFSVFHLFNPNINTIGLINIILAGIFFSLIYLKSNSILLATIIHAFWNFSIGCIFGSNISGVKIISFLKYSPQKPFIWSGGDFGFEGSIITTIIFLSYSFFLYTLKPNDVLKIE
jgi:membrane protease YdiL (CAAX protease family)